MAQWTQEEIAEMALADAEIEESFCITLDEIDESRERDDYVLDGQLDFRDLHRMQYQREYNKRYYAAHKQELNERCRRYHAENREQENRRSAEWRGKNDEYSKAWHKAYYEENRAYILLKKQLSAQVNKAYLEIMRELEEAGEA